MLVRSAVEDAGSDTPPALWRENPAPVERPDAGVELRIYDVQASAGDGRVVIREDEIGRYIADAQELRGLYEHSPRDPFVVEVVGDSMKGTFRPGERVVIEPVNGDGISTDAVYLIRIEDAVFIKRLQRLPSGRVRVISDNELYPPYEIDLTAGVDLEVIGRVWGHFERL